MLTDNGIIVRRTRYACCSISHLSAMVEANTFGDAACAEKERKLWLYLLWAKGIMDDTPVEGEVGKCGDRAFAEIVAQSADCFCSPYGCVTEQITTYPPTDPCAIEIALTVIAGVPVSDRVTIEGDSPQVGDAYLVVLGPADSEWSPNTIQTWNGTGWDQTAVVTGEVIATEESPVQYWITPSGSTTPGLLFPTLTITWDGFAGNYSLVSDYPQVNAVLGRIARVEILTEDGWITTTVGPESQLASPVVFDVYGFGLEDIRVQYTQGNCSWLSGGGTVDPPVGCGDLVYNIGSTPQCDSSTFFITVEIVSAVGFVLGDIIHFVNGVQQVPIQATIGNTILGPFSEASSVEVLITNDRDAECNVNAGTFVYPSIPDADYDVFAAVDASFQNSAQPGVSYLIASNTDAIVNNWSLHVGEIWTGSAFLVPVNNSLINTTSVTGPTALWQVSAGVAYQVYPPTTLQFNTTSEVWTAKANPVAPYITGTDVEINQFCSSFQENVIFDGIVDNFADTVFPTTCDYANVSGETLYDSVCPITVPAIVSSFTPTGEPEPFSIVGLNNIVNQIFPQEDGKFIVVGSFTAYDGTPAPRVTRLNADGTLDTAFNTNIGTGSTTTVRTSAVDSLGRIYVGGTFTEFNGNAGYPYIVRLLPTGVIDTSFVVGTSFNNTTGHAVGTILVQPDDKVIVIGDFTTYNGVAASRIIRLNTDGSRDTSFDMGSGFNGASNAPTGASKIDVDGTILVSSAFGWSSYDGNAIIPNIALQVGIVRINPDGSFNSALTLGDCLTGPTNHFINNISIQPNGQVVITGSSTGYNGTPTPRLIRLNTDGTLDTAFNAGLGVGFSSTTSSNTTLPNGQILVGNGTTFQGVPTYNLVRLNADGTRDLTYNTGPGFNTSVTQTVIMPSGAILVSGNFTSFNGLTRIRLALLN